MNPFMRLGIAPDADERMIKRAYAVQLKQTRPDENPQGFQALHEAYQAALAYFRLSDNAVDESTFADSLTLPQEMEPPSGKNGASMSAPAQTPVTIAWQDPALAGESEPPAREPTLLRWETPTTSATCTDTTTPPAAFSFAVFFDSIVCHGLAGDSNRLRSVLATEPALWSLDKKERVGNEVLDALHQHMPPMPEDCFDALLEFFDLDHALTSLDPLRLLRLRTRLRLAWEFRPENVSALAKRVDIGSEQDPELSRVQRIFAELSQPFTWRGVIHNALMPFMPKQMAIFISHLDECRTQDLSPPLEPRQVQFWLASAGIGSELTWPRFLVGFLRALVTVLISASLGWLLGLLHNPAMPLILGGSVLALWGFWSAWLVWRGVNEWQGLPQSDDVSGHGRWLRFAFIPTLAVTALLIKYTVSLAIGVTLLVITILVALARYRRRAGLASFGFARGWRLLFLIPMLKVAVLATGALARFSEIGVAMAVGIWMADLWKQRAYLRLRSRS